MRGAAITAVVAAAALFCSACKEDAGRLEWQVIFATEALRERASFVDLSIHAGRCALESATEAELYSARAEPGEAVQAPGQYPPGEYAFRAVAVDGECLEFAAGCADVLLPSPNKRDRVDVELASEPNMDLCPSGICDTDRCVLDGGVDADGGAYMCEADVDRNGLVQATDISLTGTCEGKGLSEACGVCGGGTCAAADVDCDGDVDRCDTSRVLCAFNHRDDCCGAAVVCGRCDLPDGGCTEATMDVCADDLGGAWVSADPSCSL